jgi:hypothetical protein
MILTAKAFEKMSREDIIELRDDASDAAEDLKGTPHFVARLEAEELARECTKELARRLWA